MKVIYTLLCFFLAGLTSYAQTVPIPHLQKRGLATQLIVQGKPFLALAGELHNSSTSSASYMHPIWKQMAQKNLNTVVAPVYWELLEPAEGKFDFSLVDSMLMGARKQNLHLVILWFGSWKNGYSSYTPGWIKNNYEKYPRARDKNGKPVQMLSTFGEASMLADAKAFKTLMEHIKAVDAKQQTVITAQIENEVGLFYEPREYSEAAKKAWKADVPQDLMNYMISHKNKLLPELDSVWKANGYKISGSWEDVFGKSVYDEKNWRTLSYLTEELFTVYHYAKYIGRVAAAGKEAYPIPMYVNAWIKQEGTFWPGKYPAGGAEAHTLDIWRAAAPSLDFISPDIYVPDAKYYMSWYHRSGNPLFIPEIRPGQQSANEAFWAYGQHDAICFSPFGIDESKPKDDPITKTYAALAQVKELILKHNGKGTMAGIYLDTIHPKQEFNLGKYHINAQLEGKSYQFAGFGWGQKRADNAGGLIINIAPDEFVIVGKDFNMTFSPLDPDGRNLDVEYFDEGTFVNGKWVTTRRLNGDEGTGGGDYGFGFGNPLVASLRFQPSPSGDYSIVRFKIYRYK